MLKYLALLVLILLGATSADAFSIESEYVNLYQVGGRFYQNKTVTIQCTDGDFDAPKTYITRGGDGTPHNITFICHRPLRRYLLTLVGFIPGDGALYTAKVDLVQAATKYNASSTSNRPGDRQLLASTSGKAIGSAISYVGCGMFALGCNDDPVLTVEDITGLTEELDKRDKAQNALLNVTNKWVDQLLRSQENNEVRFNRVEKFANATLDALIAANKSLSITHANLANFQAAATKDVSNLYLGVNGLRDDLSGTIIPALKASINRTSQLEVNIGLVADAVRTLSIQLGNLTEGVRKGQFKSQAQMRSLVVLANAQAQNILALSTFDQLNRVMTTALHSLINTVMSGFQLTPFLESMGSPGAANIYNLGSNAAITLTTVRARYIAPGQKGSITEFTVRCSSLFMVSVHRPAFVYRDILDMFGPAGCSSSTEGPNMCNCWIEMRDYYCVLPSIPPTWDASDDLSYSQATTGQVIDQCQGNPIISWPTGIHSTSVTSQTRIFEIMALLCQRGTDLSRPGYTVFSTAFFEVVSATESPALCTGDLESSLEPSAGSVNLLFVLTVRMLSAYQFALLHIDDYTRLILGVMPQRTSRQVDELALDEFDQRVTRHQRSFVAYDLENMLPVYQIEPTTTTTNFEVIVDGSSQVTSDVSVGTVWSQLIYKSDVIIGNPYGLTTGDLVYNVPSREKSISTDADVRRGPTYALIRDVNIATDSTRFNPAAWTTQNGVNFDHIAGASVASKYARALTPDGLCSSVSFGDGDDCLIRQHFIVTTDAVNNLMTLSDRDGYSIIATVNVPEGELISLRASLCPTTLMSVDSGNTVVIKYTNSLSVTNTLVLQQTGGCPSTRTINIPPQGTFTQIVSLCQETPAGTSEMIHIYYSDNGEPLAECPNTLNVTLTPRFAETFQGLASNNFMQTLSVSVLDQSLLNQRRIVDEFMGLMTKLVIFTTTIPTYQGIALDPFVYANSTNLLNELEAARIRILQQMAAQAAAGLVNYTKDAAPYEDAQRQAAAELSAAIEKARAEVQKLSGDNIKSGADFKELNATGQQFKAFYLDFVKADQSTLRNMTALFAKIAAWDPNNGGSMGSGPFDILGDLILHGARIVGNAANSGLNLLGDLVGGGGDCGGLKAIMCAIMSIFGPLLSLLGTILAIVVIGYGAYYGARYLINQRREAAKTKAADEAREKEKRDKDDARKAAKAEREERRAEEREEEREKQEDERARRHTKETEDTPLVLTAPPPRVPTLGAPHNQFSRVEDDYF